MDARRWAEVCAEFDVLVELGESARQIRLAAIGAKDMEQRRWLETLLEADAAADVRLSSIESPLLGSVSPPALDQDASASACSQAPDPFGLIGRDVSHFRVREVLEAGGTGVVYRAEDVRLGRHVALKFLLPHLEMDASAKMRFLEEARTVASLDHPNLCALHDVGESAEGRLFLAMPLYAGETLETRLARDGRLAVDEAMEIAHQVAQGLEYAHSAGLVHRDLKPGNLVVGDRGGVKILDFGLARALDLTSNTAGVVMGTVAYMAPEQLRNQEVDARVDLWALGVVLYEMLTGRHPFVGESRAATAQAVVHEEPVPPSQLRSDLAPAIERIILTLLSKEPANRFGSAGEFLRELASLRSSEPHGGHAGGTVRSAPTKSYRRIIGNRSAVLVLLLVVGALAASAVATRLGEVETGTTLPAGRSIAVLPFLDLSGEQGHEYLSDGITDDILMTLANVGDLRVISRTSVMRYKGTTKPARQIAAELNVTHLLEGSVQRMDQWVRINVQLIDPSMDQPLWAQQFDRPMQDIFAVQSEIARVIGRSLQVRLSPAEQTRLNRQPTSQPAAHDHVLRAREYLRNGGRSEIDAALVLLRSAHRLDPQYADVFATMAAGFLARSRHPLDPEGYRMWLDSAVVAARRAIALDPELDRGHAALGSALNLLGDLDGSFDAHTRAVQLNPHFSDGLADLYHWGLGRLDEAARLWQPALAADPTNAAIHWLAGRTYLDLGLPARARPLIEKALEFRPEFVWLYFDLSRAYLQEGRREEAGQQIERVLTATEQDLVGFALAFQIAVALGDLPLARHYGEEALSRLPDPAPVVEANVLPFVWILQQSGESERAGALLQSATRNLEKLWGGNPKRPEEYMDLARLRVLEGDREGALQQIEAAVRHGWRLIHQHPRDPVLGSLEGDPRYDRLMSQVRADVDRQRSRVEREGW